MKERWAEHKAVCRKRQAVRLGKEWARAGNKSLILTYAAHLDDTRTMKELAKRLRGARSVPPRRRLSGR